MKRVESLAADYWIEHTQEIYESDLHISSPVMEAYEAGFRKACELLGNSTIADEELYGRIKDL